MSIMIKAVSKAPSKKQLSFEWFASGDGIDVEIPLDEFLDEYTADELYEKASWKHVFADEDLGVSSVKSIQDKFKDNSMDAEFFETFMGMTSDKWLGKYKDFIKQIMLLDAENTPYLVHYHY